MDPLNGPSGVANVRSQMRTIRKAYRVLEAERMLKHDIFEGEHKWNGVKAIPWMKHHLAEKKNRRTRRCQESTPCTRDLQSVNRRSLFRRPERVLG